MFYIIIIHINLFWSLYVTIIIGAGASGLAGSNQPEAAFGKRRLLYWNAYLQPEKKFLQQETARCNLTNRYADGYDEVKAFLKI